MSGRKSRKFCECRYLRWMAALVWTMKALGRITKARQVEGNGPDKERAIFFLYYFSLDFLLCLAILSCHFICNSSCLPKHTQAFRVDLNGFRLLVIWITSHLSGLKLTYQSTFHLCSLVRFFEAELNYPVMLFTCIRGNRWQTIYEWTSQIKADRQSILRRGMVQVVCPGALLMWLLAFEYHFLISIRQEAAGPCQRVASYSAIMELAQ